MRLSGIWPVKPQQMSEGEPRSGLTFREALCWMMGRRQRFRVTGRSMLPTLAAGDYVLVDRQAYTKRLPNVGEITLSQHPYEHDVVLIKRVQALHGSDIWLSSDNPAEGTDSRRFGFVPATLLLGRVTTHIDR